MNRFTVDMGLVDVRRGETLPDTLVCNAIILSRDPGHDGSDFEPTDIVSEAPVRLELRKEYGRLRNVSKVPLLIRLGPWPQGYLCFLDDDDIVIARGGMRVAGGGHLSGVAVALIDDICLREARPN